MKSFMLLIRGGSEGWASMSPEQTQQTMQRYVGWTTELATSGQLVHADELDIAHTVVSGTGGEIVTDGPFAETKDLISGYYMYHAEDMAAAVAIARACPALAHGSSLEIHPVVQRG